MKFEVRHDLELDLNGKKDTCLISDEFCSRNIMDLLTLWSEVAICGKIW